jgi:hypothetical protein
MLPMVMMLLKLAPPMQRRARSLKRKDGQHLRCPLLKSS